jgi:hypothetical protein
MKLPSAWIVRPTTRTRWLQIYAWRLGWLLCGVDIATELIDPSVWESPAADQAAALITAGAHGVRAGTDDLERVALQLEQEADELRNQAHQLRRQAEWAG